MEKVYKKFKDRVQFYLVYIKEAHPADGRWPDPWVKVNDPETWSERRKVATRCASALDLSLPILIDDMKNTASRAYAAWPDRLYVIGCTGRVVYKSGRGPWGFKPGEWERAIEKAVRICETEHNHKPDRKDREY